MLHEQGKEPNQFYSDKSLEDASLSVTNNSKIHFIQRQYTLRHIFSAYSKNNNNKQLLDEVEHDIMNYQTRGLCYLPKPKAEADNTDRIQ